MVVPIEEGELPGGGVGGGAVLRVKNARIKHPRSNLNQIFKDLGMFEVEIEDSKNMGGGS